MTEINRYMSCREENDVEGLRLYWYITTNLAEARWPHGHYYG